MFVFLEFLHQSSLILFPCITGVGNHLKIFLTFRHPLFSNMLDHRKKLICQEQDTTKLLYYYAKTFSSVSYCQSINSSDVVEARRG